MEILRYSFKGLRLFRALGCDYRTEVADYIKKREKEIMPGSVPFFDEKLPTLGGQKIP
jgi:hypothetical protein